MPRSVRPVGHPRTQRTVDVMGLLARLAPDVKTQLSRFDTGCIQGLFLCLIEGFEKPQAGRLNCLEQFWDLTQ